MNCSFDIQVISDKCPGVEVINPEGEEVEVRLRRYNDRDILYY
jgi:hypothetical protein